jgi:hypothetical protein
MDKAWNSFVWIKWSKDFDLSKAEWFKQHSDHIKEWGTVTGEWDAYIKLNAANYQEAEKFVVGTLRKQPWIASTLTQPASWNWTA